MLYIAAVHVQASSLALQVAKPPWPMHTVSYIVAKAAQHLEELNYKYALNSSDNTSIGAYT